MKRTTLLAGSRATLTRQSSLFELRLGFRWLAIGALACGAFVAQSSISPAQKLQVLPLRVVLANDSRFPRVNEVVELRRNDLAASDTNLFPVFRSGSTILTSQIVVNKDSRQWNSVLMQVSLPAHSKKIVGITWIEAAGLPHFPVAADVRLSLRSTNGVPNDAILSEQRTRGFIQNIAEPKYQLEGPGIENDKFALRMFFDHRNGKDLYGKLTPEPVLEQMGLVGSWHTMQSWGMDILKTGDSIGACGLVVFEGGRFYRLSDADLSTFMALYDGPLQASFRLNFKNWDIGTGQGDGSETLSMTTGEYLFKDRITLSLNAKQRLVMGLPSFYSTIDVKHTVHNQSISSISTYGPQADGTGSRLGLAIFFPTENYSSMGRTSDSAESIPSSVYVVMKPSAEKEHTIFVAVGWEKTDKQFATEKGFDDFLEQQADVLAHPIRVISIR